MNDPVIASIGKSERDVAAELHARVKAKLLEIAGILDEANAIGIRIEFELGMDAFGRNAIDRLDIVKSLGPK